MHEVACPSMEHSGQHASTRGDMQVRCAKFWVTTMTGHCEKSCALVQRLVVAAGPGPRRARCRQPGANSQCCIRQRFAEGHTHCTACQPVVVSGRGLESTPPARSLKPLGRNRYIETTEQDPQYHCSRYGFLQYIICRLQTAAWAAVEGAVFGRLLEISTNGSSLPASADWASSTEAVQSQNNSKLGLVLLQQSPKVAYP